MEKFERKSIIGVLTQGRELANELKRQLHPTTTSTKACDALMESILSSYENALTLLTLLENGENPFESAQGSEGSDQNSKDQLQQFKKRKTLPRWSEQVRVCSGVGFEGQLDDGYSWRKYGQKDILGANHPRAYYRCTHRNTQGCLATKQVQRADEDPSLFEVIYRGKHSCRLDKLKQKNENVKKEEEKRHSQNVKAEAKELDLKEENFPFFPFFSTPIESENVEPRFFSDIIGTSYSPPFLSPATSESYFSLSPCPVNDFGIGHSLQSSESDFAEIISNPTPIEDFPFRDLDFSIGQVNFECDLSDALNYF